MSSKCPTIATSLRYLVISNRLQSFVIGLISYDGFFDELAIFKVKLVEAWRIYIQINKLSKS